MGSANRIFIVLYAEQQHKFSFMETPRKFNIAKVKFQAYGSKVLQ